MWPEGEEPEANPRSDADEKASTDEPSSARDSGSPFSAPEIQEELRSLSGIGMATRSVVQAEEWQSLAEESRPAEKSPPAEEPPPGEESPFTTPEVEEVERERPSTDKGDSERG